MVCKKGVLRNFEKFTGKHLCQRFFFNKVIDLSPAILLKKRLQHRCFPVNFAKFLRNTFSQRTPPVAASDYDFLINISGAKENVDSMRQKQK